MVKITSLIIPLELIFPDSTLILLGVRESMEYKDGEITDNVLGYRYEVVETKTYEKFIVKILDAPPAITQEEIDNAEEKYMVTFVNAVARPYYTQMGHVALAFRADAINFLNN